MFLMRAERHFSSEPSHGWFGVTEYVHGHRPTDSLHAVARHWLLTESSRLFTGTEDEPERHGPWPSSPDLWRRFEECSPARAAEALRAWGEDVDAFAKTSSVAGEMSEWAERWVTAEPPASCLLLIPTAEEATSQPVPGVGLCVGFVQVLWIRPSDDMLVVVTCSDD
jgi:hypothetical protein